MLEAAVHGFGGSVAGAGAAEGGQDVLGSLRQQSSEGADLGEGVEDAAIDRVDQPAVASAPSEKSVDQHLKIIAADHKTRDGHNCEQDAEPAPPDERLKKLLKSDNRR